MPLIFAAMLHFIPVLTRTAAPARRVAGLPAWAALVGWGVFAAFAMGRLAWLPLLALPAAGLAAWLAAWGIGRGRAALGAPHAGLAWYVAALCCLALALFAVAAMAVWPEHTLALKRLHLHLNLLGFVALTAVGTLQVLLPTAARRFDAQAARRLRLTLWPTLAGVVPTALGAAWAPRLAWVGLVPWLWVLAWIARDWWRAYRRELFAWHGAAPLLGAALAGLALALLTGTLAACGVLPHHGAAHLFVLGFLFPLVSGAVGWLLPLWRFPAAPDAARHRLLRWSGARAVLYLAGSAGAATGAAWGFAPALLALVLTGAAVLAACLPAGEK
jgi:hypothetical protein